MNLQNVMSQWLVAASLLGNVTINKTTLPAYLNGPTAGIYERRTHPETCVGTTESGIKVVYYRIYKSGNNAICALLHSFAKTKETQSVTVTFVREPLLHFISGFSEIIYRVHQCINCTWTTYVNVSAALTARAFVNDFIGQRLNGAVYAHAFPQFAFVHKALKQKKINFVGTLQTTNGILTSVRTLNVSGLRSPANVGHKKTNSGSNNQFRKAMESLLASCNPYKEAMCRVLLIDYVCFNFTLPGSCCSNMLLQHHNVRCPVKVPVRHE